MVTEQLTHDLIFHLQFVLIKVRENLQTADLQKVMSDTGISYSNLCRLKRGGAPNLATLELLAYYFSPKPEPKPLDVAKLFRRKLEL